VEIAIAKIVGVEIMMVVIAMVKVAMVGIVFFFATAILWVEIVMAIYCGGVNKVGIKAGV
jgi:hypothetical protein